MGKILENNGDALSADNVEHLVLYDSPPSPCSRRCRITMLEKGLDWDTVNVNLALMEQRHPDYLAINPNGFVPTLAHGDLVIIESGVINSYLEDQFPEVPLIPATAIDAAAVRMWQASELAMAKVFRPVMYALNGGPIKHISRTEEEAEQIARLATTDPYDLDWERRVWRLEVLSREQIQQNLAWLRAWLQPIELALRDADFLVGNQFSQADIAVYPRLCMYANVDLDISADEFPNVTRWMATLADRPSFVDSETEAARGYSALVRSDMMKKVRAQFQLDECERDPGLVEEIREYGRQLRDKFGVDKLLNATASTRALPQPAAEFRVEARQRQSPRSSKPQKISLYGWQRSPHARRIEMLLRALDVDFDTVEVDVAREENRLPEFLALNPLGEVPVLLVDDTPIFDSLAIAEYLGNTYSSPSLYVPQSSVEVATHNTWLALESGTHKEFSPLLAPLQFAGSAREPAALGDERHRYLASRMLQKLQFIEDALAESVFLCDTKPAYADIAWYSRIAFMLQTSVADELRRLANIERWLQDMRRFTGDTLDVG